MAQAILCLTVLCMPALMGCYVLINAWLKPQVSRRVLWAATFYCLEPIVNMPLMWWWIQWLDSLSSPDAGRLAVAPLPVAVLLLLWLVPRTEPHERHILLFFARSGTVRFAFVALIFWTLPSGLFLLLVPFGYLWLWFCIAQAAGYLIPDEMGMSDNVRGLLPRYNAIDMMHIIVSRFR